jgi:hypothetical protein
MLTIRRKIAWVSLFSLAMGFMEAAVVIYLRRIYYPNGFSFPLVPVEPNIGSVEFLREAATIIMLIGIGILSGKNSSQKFAFFIYSFAIWDIFYYIFLKIFIGWPEALLTWDILFLIPVPWVGPILAPCMLSLTMVLSAVLIIHNVEETPVLNINRREWALLITGSLVAIISFIRPYFVYMNSESAAWTPGSGDALFNEISHFVPSGYEWWIFILGESLILLGTVLFKLRANKITSQ